MAISEIGTGTSNPLGGEYQVFLSFRGKDTRHGFTDTLYNALVEAGIHVFIDNEELQPGERIGGNLLRAIDESRLYIPIFSPSYASSHWCLRELAKMVENTYKPEEDGNKKVILPIFYNVKPDDVKLRTQMYNNDIQNLMKQFSSKDIETWQQVLRKVGGISGLDLQKYTGDGDLSKSVVNEVVDRLKTRQREVTADLVGMEDRIAAINNLLDIDSGGVRLIGICGMGGMGKTTLAKKIFNQLCPRFGKNCSFLEDVRETEKTKGLIKLQEQLLSDISNSRGTRNIVNTDDGIKAIGDTICNKKALIVLDDVDNGNQIQNLIGRSSLHPGTRILVTTRDNRVLTIRGAKCEILPHEMEGLSNKDALQLFSRHAFDDISPPPDYDTLSKDIVSRTGGLPLALEAIGSSLFGRKDIEIWKEMQEELMKTPHNDVLGKLRITYNSLKPFQQQIFLDVACFFIGSDWTDPIYMWQDCGFSPKSAIDVLIERCMIKVLDNNRFWMHDQFRDLGRSISNQEHSRLWAPHDIIRELRSTEIKTSVQALYCNDLSLRLSDRVADRDIIVTSEQIKRFPRLQLLRLGDITYQGDFTGCLSELKWIDLVYTIRSSCMATNLNLENAVVIEITGDWVWEDAVISLAEGAKKLKALTLSNIQSLHRTPTFSQDSVLEKLTFNHCRYLKEIDWTIGKLQWLTDLTVEYSEALKKLPEQIGKLEKLQLLSLVGCEILRELPDSVSKLESLTELHVSCTGITRLPDSIDRLQSLSSLDLRKCHQIQELPKLPGSLTTLWFESKSLRTVPDLSNLTNLVELLLSDASDFYEEWNMIQPCELRWIGRLSKLRKLNLCLLNVHTTCTDWASLTLLEELTLKGLDLQKLEQLPSNLRVLELDNTRVEQVELHELRQLEKLTIKRCEPVKRLSIPSSLRKLRHASMSSCDKLVEVQLLGVLESMEQLHIIECKSLERLVCLSSSSSEAGWNELQAPELSDGGRRVSLVSSSLKMLQRLTLRTCPELREIQFVSALESLKVFVVRECISLKRIGGLSNLKNLAFLEFRDCKSLQVVEGINELERLRWLQLCRCRSMGRIIDASSSKIPNECRMDIWHCRESPGTGLYALGITWESYKEEILNAATQASDSGPSEQQDDGDDDEANGIEGDDDKDNNVHEDLQSSHGPPLISSMGDNDENNDVSEEGKGKGDDDGDEDKTRTRKRETMKKLKRRGFCSCLTGLRMFIPWIRSGNDEKEEESDDEEAKEEVTDGTE